MSTINANYQDTNISAIRQMLAGKNDDIPILLMPVRIETRFMRVPIEQRVASMTTNLETTLFDLADTQILLSQNLEKSTKLLKRRY